MVLLEPFGPSFMRSALVAGVLAAVVCAVVGTWVVLRGMTFLGDALAHGVLPGIAIAILIGADVTLGALVGAAVMVVGINAVTRRTRLSDDTAIGLLFVGMLAAGVIVISRARSFSTALDAILFGNPLGVRRADQVMLAGAAVVVIAVTLVCWRMFIVLSFHPDKAAALGLRPKAAHLLLLALIAVAVVSSFRAVGTLLVFGLLVGPPATASLLVRRVPVMMLTAVGLGIVAVVIGLEASWFAGTAAGATIAFTAVAIFFVVLSAQAAIRLGRRATA